MDLIIEVILIEEKWKVEEYMKVRMMPNMKVNGKIISLKDMEFR
jgi:hypothetical protein